MQEHPLPVEDWIDLHTFRPQDVPEVVRSYLEAAWEAGHREVRIVHGRGIGVQRERVRSVLEGHPLVLAFDDARTCCGGWGATVVVLGEGGPPPAVADAQVEQDEEGVPASPVAWILLGAAFLAAAAFLLVVLLQLLRWS